jgi:hypothetical protein
MIVFVKFNLRTQPRKITVVSRYKYFQHVTDWNMSHGENKLTPIDNIQHVFVAIYHSEEHLYSTISK